MNTIIEMFSESQTNDLSTARPSVLVFMIYASLAWILITRSVKAISLHYNITDQLSD